MKFIDRILDIIFRKDIKIVYCDNLYVSDGLNEKNVQKLKKKVEQGKGSACLLLKSENKNDCIDIVTSFQLRSKVWEGKTAVCIGLADGKESATDLVQTIIMDCLEKTGRIDLKEYICSL